MMAEAVPANGAESPLLVENPKIIRGQLANGLQYVMLPNAYPPDRIEAYLEVRAGSVNELEHEQGLAHVVEHAVFLGTRSFPDEEAIRKQLAALGMSYGADTNAFTDFRHTVYTLHCPSKMDNVAASPISAAHGSPAVQQPRELRRRLQQVLGTEDVDEVHEPDEIVEGDQCSECSEATEENTVVVHNSLQAMLELLHEIVLCPLLKDIGDERLQSEKEAVLSEQQMRNTLQARIEQALTAQLHSETILPHRFPIGTIECIKSFTWDHILNFHNRYYVPSNMTLYLVGVFDVCEAQQLIDSQFMKAGLYPLPIHVPDDGFLPIQHVFGQRSPNPFLEFKHRSLHQFSLTLTHKLPVEHIRTESDLRNCLIDSFIDNVLTGRLDDRVHQLSDSVFQSIHWDPSVSHREACTLNSVSVSARCGRWAAAVWMAFFEFSRLARFGVSEEELQFYRRLFLREARKDAQQSDAQDSGDLMEELLEENDSANRITSRRQEYEMYLRLGVSADDINERIQSHFTPLLSDEFLPLTICVPDKCTREDRKTAFEWLHRVVELVTRDQGPDGLQRVNDWKQQWSSVFQATSDVAGDGNLTDEIDWSVSENEIRGVMRSAIELGATFEPKPFEWSESLVDRDSVAAHYRQRLRENGVESVPETIGTSQWTERTIVRGTDSVGGTAAELPTVLQGSLQNGVHVSCLQSTVVPEDVIVLLNIRGGQSLEKVPGSLSVASKIWTQSGAGAYSPELMRRFCEHYGIQMDVRVEAEALRCTLSVTQHDDEHDETEGVDSLSGLERLFQVMWLSLEQPKWDANAFARTVQDCEHDRQALEKDLDRFTSHEFVRLSIVDGNDPSEFHFRTPTVNELQRLTIETVAEELTHQWQRPSASMEVVVVGDVDPIEVEDVVGMYMGHVYCGSARAPQPQVRADAALLQSFRVPFPFQGRPDILQTLSRLFSSPRELCRDAYQARVSICNRVRVDDDETRASVYFGIPCLSRWGIFGPYDATNPSVDVARREDSPWKTTFADRLRHPMFAVRATGLLAELVTNRLYRVIREELGLTYAISCSPIQYDGYDIGMLMINMVPFPDRIDETVDAVMKVLTDIWTGTGEPFTDDEMEQAQRPLVASIRTALSDNDYWVRLLADVLHPTVPFKVWEGVRGVDEFFGCMTLREDIAFIMQYVLPQHTTALIGVSSPGNA